MVILFVCVRVDAHTYFSGFSSSLFSFIFPFFSSGRKFLGKKRGGKRGKKEKREEKKGKNCLSSIPPLYPFLSTQTEEKKKRLTHPPPPSCINTPLRAPEFAGGWTVLGKHKRLTIILEHSSAGGGGGGDDGGGSGDDSGRYMLGIGGSGNVTVL